MNFVVALVASTSFAAVPGLTLNWSAPVECPSGAQLEAAVARQLGEMPLGPPLVVSAIVTHVGESWQVELTNAEGGTRTLTGSTCRAVASASVVVMALMIDPTAVTDTPPVIEEEPAQSPRLFAIGVMASGDLGTLPKLTPGLGLTIDLELASRFSIEANLQAWLPQSTPDGTPGATLTLFAGALGVRRDFEFGPLFIAPVVLLEAGAMRGRSFGVTNSDVNYGFWFAARAGLALGVSFGVFRISVRGELVVPLVSPRFIADGVGALYTPPFLSGRGVFTIELRFPPRESGVTSN